MDKALVLMFWLFWQAPKSFHLASKDVLPQFSWRPASPEAAELDKWQQGWPWWLSLGLSWTLWLRDTLASLLWLHLWDRKREKTDFQGWTGCRLFVSLPALLCFDKSNLFPPEQSHNRSHSPAWKRLLLPAWEKMKKKWQPRLLCHHTEMINPGWGDPRHFSSKFSWIPGPSLALAMCPKQINWILPARPLTQQMCCSHFCCRYNIIHVQGMTTI